MPPLVTLHWSSQTKDNHPIQLSLPFLRRTTYHAPHPRLLPTPPLVLPLFLNKSRPHPQLLVFPLPAQSAPCFMPCLQSLDQQRMTSPLGSCQVCDIAAEHDVERLETRVNGYLDPARGSSSKAIQEKSENATIEEYQSSTSSSKCPTSEHRLDAHSERLPRHVGKQLDHPDEEDSRKLMQKGSEITPAEQHRITSLSNKCPVCEQRFDGDDAQFEKHVNDHLDQNEEELSKQLALDLSTQAPTRDTQDSRQLLITNDDADLAESIGPAERMMREGERNDAALAAALAESTQIASNGVYVSQSLRGSLSDSAERYYPDVLQLVIPLYDPKLIFLRRKYHVCTKLDLFSSNIAGLGWDCGYRNIQMMLSALLRSPETATMLNKQGITEVPSIPEIAGRIERGWKEGYDPEGAKQYCGTLVGKDVWIGATEAFVLLRSLNINANIQDFETPAKVQRKVLYEWVFKYFDERCNGRSCSIHRKGRIGSNNPCVVPPLFCQWQGHSVTIIGAEKTRSGDVVLVTLDPSRGFYTSLMAEISLQVIRRDIDHPQFLHPRYQFVWVAPKTGRYAEPNKVHKGMLGRLRFGGPS